MIFSDFEQAVRSHWPTYKGSVQAVWDAVIKNYPIEQIKDALYTQKCHDFDATRPSWKMIIADLAGTKQRSTKSKLQLLLDLVRRALGKGCYTAQAKRMTDEEVFQNFLDAQTAECRLLPFTGKPRPDPDGRFAKAAAMIRWSVADRLAQDLRERGQFVPPWLEPGEEPYREPVTSELFRKWFPNYGNA